MSEQPTVQAGERKQEIKKAMYILIVWTLIVVAAGFLLVIFSDPFAALFT